MYHQPTRLKKHHIAILLTFLMAFCDSCVRNNRETASTRNQEEEFHADNDIAMTVRSIVDAIRVGETLDSTFYDFQGVLTDGQGTPLYTDIQGLPGEWIVNVGENENVSIRNVKLGDLLADDLRLYILNQLRLDESSRVKFPESENDKIGNTEISIYDFKGGYVRFESKIDTTTNGNEGSFLTITVIPVPRDSVGKQKAA